ncbi:unnamed protein product [Gadus morhua 'NCC']
MLLAGSSLSNGGSHCSDSRVGGTHWSCLHMIQGILGLPDVITPSSSDVSSPPGWSSDVSEQSRSGNSEDTPLSDEDVLGNKIGVPALSILIYAAVRRQEPTFVDRIKEIHQHSQPQRAESSRLQASSGRSKNQQCKEALGLPNRDITGQEDLWSSRRRTLLKLLRCLGELYKSWQEHCSEQDAHEFLLLVLMKMKMEGEALQETSTSPSYICPVQNFEFRLQCVCTCSSCGDKGFLDGEQNHFPLTSTRLSFSLQIWSAPASSAECQASEIQHFLTLPRVLHMKRFHHDGAWLRKVTDAASVPPWLSLASLVGKQGAAAGIGHTEWNILTVQETGTENSRKCMWSLTSGRASTLTPVLRTREEPAYILSTSSVEQARETISH